MSSGIVYGTDFIFRCCYIVSPLPIHSVTYKISISKLPSFPRYTFSPNVTDINAMSSGIVYGTDFIIRCCYTVSSLPIHSVTYKISISKLPSFRRCTFSPNVIDINAMSSGIAYGTDLIFRCCYTVSPLPIQSTKSVDSG